MAEFLSYCLFISLKCYIPTLTYKYWCFENTCIKRIFKSTNKSMLALNWDFILQGFATKCCLFFVFTVVTLYIWLKHAVQIIPEFKNFNYVFGHLFNVTCERF
ncbi:hypothetical protein ACF0H5_001962 [Mactra antiquata]